jgi:HEPN domain-containing protein
MTSDRMARRYLAQARYRMAEVRNAVREQQSAVAVRRRQEAVELALKAVLRASGVDPPRWHDVGDVLRANTARLPPALQETVERLARISSDLRQDREPAFHGDEAAGLPPEELYGETDARRTGEDAAFVVDVVGRALLDS